MKKSDIFWQTYLNLEKEAIEVSKYIFITDEVIKNRNGVSVTENCYTQMETFSPYIADLLVRTCVQIEAVSKELYFDNGGEKARGDSTVLFDDDCLRLIDKLWSTHSKSVLVVAPFFNLTKEEHKNLKPLKEAHRRHEYWEKAYQAVKHDRYSYLYMGNVKAFIQAMAALYLLNVFFRNEKWSLRYEDVRKRDYSMGSSLFAVNPPVLDALWEGNKAIESDSPFVVRYQDAVYQQIDDIRKKENDSLSEFMRNQPEWNDSEFLAYIKDVVEKAKGGTFHSDRGGTFVSDTIRYLNMDLGRFLEQWTVSTFFPPLWNALTAEKEQRNTAEMDFVKEVLADYPTRRVLCDGVRHGIY